MMRSEPPGPDPSKSGPYPFFSATAPRTHVPPLPRNHRVFGSDRLESIPPPPVTDKDSGVFSCVFSPVVQFIKWIWGLFFSPSETPAEKFAKKLALPVQKLQPLMTGSPYPYPYTLIDYCLLWKSLPIEDPRSLSMEKLTQLSQTLTQLNPASLRFLHQFKPETTLIPDWIQQQAHVSEVSAEIKTHLLQFPFAFEARQCLPFLVFLQHQLRGEIPAVSTARTNRTPRTPRTPRATHPDAERVWIHLQKGNGTPLTELSEQTQSLLKMLTTVLEYQPMNCPIEEDTKALCFYYQYLSTASPFTLLHLIQFLDRLPYAELNTRHMDEFIQHLESLPTNTRLLLGKFHASPFSKNAFPPPNISKIYDLLPSNEETEINPNRRMLGIGNYYLLDKMQTQALKSFLIKEIHQSDGVISPLQQTGSRQSTPLLRVEEPLS